MHFLFIAVKIVTLPLTTSQLESTTKMQKLTPLQKRIQERYADDEPTKNKMLSSLFQAANVNPLAGCAPALIQIPIFISLYRALQNLIAENKLDEPFLWIPGKPDYNELLQKCNCSTFEDFVILIVFNLRPKT